ncbi:Imm26 family immunity protein [Pseudomonas sp. W2-17]|uniref:Imm26 family immunity protein n=1 Tax=Pseudomonas sp. W2-17 TaxID=3058039 RepID=UPI0034E08D47
MKLKQAVNSGDYFTIPMSDGRQAICQAIWIGKNNSDPTFKRVFAFCVLSVGDKKHIPEEISYLSFQNHRGTFKVIFTAVDKLLSGEWPIIGSGPIKDQRLVNLEFNMAGDLYLCGEFVRKLSGEEYKNYLLMGVAGYVLVENYLNQY